MRFFAGTCNLSWRAGFAALALALALVAPSLQASEITLERAINLALTQNRELLRAQTLLDESGADVEAAEAQFSTHIQPILSVQKIAGTEIKNYGVQASKEFETGTTVSASATRGDTVLPNGVVIVQPAESVSLSQPLFRNAGAMAAQANENDAISARGKAQRQFEQQRQDLVVLVVNDYTELFRLQQQIKVDQQVVQHATELLRLNTAYELVGRSKQLDTMKAKFELDRAQATLAADQQKLASAQSGFAELLGFPATSVFIAQATGWADYGDLDPDSAVQTAFANRLDYAQARQDYLDAGRNNELARNQLEPQLDLNLGYQRFAQSPVPGSSVPAGGGVFLGLSGNSTVADPAAHAAVHKSEAAREAALENIGIVEAQIAREVRDGISEYQQARTENGIAGEAAKSADGRLRLARDLFHLGRADSFAVADAEQAYVVAEAELLNANAEVTRASYRLSQALGTLLAPPAALKPDSGGTP